MKNNREKVPCAAEGSQRCMAFFLSHRSVAYELKTLREGGAVGFEVFDWLASISRHQKKDVDKQ